jgi:hypothetical protein
MEEKKNLTETEFLIQCNVQDDTIYRIIVIATRKMLSQCTKLPIEKIYPDDHCCPKTTKTMTIC